MNERGGTFADVLAELGVEHADAMERHGFTDEHDDRHGDQDWAWRILRRVSELMAPPTVIDQSDDDRRRALLEVAHIAASAVASHDRRMADLIPAVIVNDHDEGLARVTQNVAAGVGLGEIVVSTGTECLYVARGGEESIERHAFTCTAYKPGPGITCRGACLTEEPT